MTVISVDAFGPSRRVTPHRRSFQRRNAVASLHVGNAKQPTEFGYHLLKLMGDAGLKPAGLARAAGVSASTITRLVYGGVDRPDSDTLGRVARGIITAGPPPDDVEESVRDLHNQLLHAAGYRLGAAPPPPALHPRVMLLQQAIGEGSPLDEADIQYLDGMVGHLLAPFERKLRRRAS